MNQKRNSRGWNVASNPVSGTVGSHWDRRAYSLQRTGLFRAEEYGLCHRIYARPDPNGGRYGANRYQNIYTSQLWSVAADGEGEYL